MACTEFLVFKRVFVKMEKMHLTSLCSKHSIWNSSEHNDDILKLQITQLYMNWNEKNNSR